MVNTKIKGGVSLTNHRDSYMSLAEDFREGLTSDPKWIFSKYFYDEVGSKLFEKICELPEYYLTRTELAILKKAAGNIARITEASELIELGSGTSQKIKLLIESFLGRGKSMRYVPLDISETVHKRITETLTEEYPEIQIDGIVGDFTQDLHLLKPTGRCLVAFLGSTIGNFSDKKINRLLSELREVLSLGDWLLLGADLEKPVDILENAYNDSKGITAAFNKNILNVVNREAEANFNTDDFDHLAFYNVEESRIEMHLVANRDMEVQINGLQLTIHFEKGERLLTEISRKFTQSGVEKILKDAGFGLKHWFISEDGYFALALAGVEKH